MNSVVIANITRVIGLILFQVLILSQIELHGFISPYIYPLAILLLPFETPTWVLLLVGFFTGLSIDVFANTHGLHASVTVLLAYLRSTIISFNRPPGDYESTDRPNIPSMGINWFLIYAGMAIFIHHACYFALEAYSWAFLGRTIARIIGSTVASVGLVVLYEYVFYSR